MKKLNQTYFTIAVYALGVIAFSIVFLLLCVNFGMITSAVSSFLSAISSILYAVLFAFLLFPAVKRFDALYDRLFSKKKPHPYLVSGFSIATALLITLGLVAALLIVIIPRLINDAAELYRFVLQTKERLDAFVAGNAAEHPLLNDLYKAMMNFLFGSGGTNSIMDSLVSSLSGIVSGIVGQVSSIFMGLIISVYLLASRRVISGIIGKLVVAILPERHVNRFVLFFKRLYTDFASFAFNRFVIAFFFGAVIFLLCLLLRVPLLSVIVLLVLVTQLIPVVGPIIGTTLSILLVVILKGPWWGLLYAAVILALQVFSTNILLPHMLPRKLRPPFAVTAAVVLLSLSLFGVIGAFVAVPIYATLSIVLRRFLIHRLAKKNLPIASDAYHGFSAAEYEAANEACIAKETEEPVIATDEDGAQ